MSTNFRALLMMCRLCCKVSAKVTDDPATIGHIDLVIVCVKSWQVETVAHVLPSILKPDSIILPIQNGIECHEVLERIVGGGRTLMGLSRMFACIKSPGVITHGAGLRTLYGEYQSDRRDRVDLLNSALCNVPGVEFISPPDIKVECWRKFCAVSCSSSMCALTRAPLKTWVAMKECESLYRRCMGEAIDVAVSKNVSLPGDMVESALENFRSLNPGISTSMARDMLQGKPSEMEWLVGALVRLGQEMGVSTPTLSTVYAALLPQEQKARGVVDYCNAGADDKD